MFLPFVKEFLIILPSKSILVRKDSPLIPQDLDFPSLEKCGESFLAAPPTDRNRKSGVTTSFHPFPGPGSPQSWESMRSRS